MNHSNLFRVLTFRVHTFLSTLVFFSRTALLGVALRREKDFRWRARRKQRRKKRRKRYSSRRKCQRPGCVVLVTSRTTRGRAFMCFSFLSLCEFSRFPVRNALTAFVFPFVLLLFARGIVREEEMTFSLFPLCFCRRCGGENFERGDDDDRHHLFVYVVYVVGSNDSMTFFLSLLFGK